MRSARYLWMVLLVLTLAAPKAVWSAKESPGVAGEKVVAEAETPAGSTAPGGRGEGFEPQGEAGKGEEIPATFGPLVTDTAIPVEKGQFVIQPTFSYSFVNNSFNHDRRRGSAGGNFQTFSMDWRFTYGLIDDMEVFVVIPYTHNWARNVDKAGPGRETSANSGGLDDINLTLKYRLVEETACLPTITALFATDFPTGKFKNVNPSALNTDVIGGGAYVFTPGLNISKYIKPFIIYGNLWYSMQTSFSDDNGKQYPGDFVTVNLAAEYPITGKWVALLELTSSWGGGRLFGPKTNVPQESLVSIVPGIEYMATDKFSVALGLNIDLAGKNTDAAITPLLSMIYGF
jgi:hypothetical protein